MTSTTQTTATTPTQTAPSQAASTQTGATQPAPPRPTTAAQRQALGAYGEKVAERHLVRHGLALLERNWTCDEGEVDLLLREDDTLVVCEVKTRTSDAAGSPHEAISDEKLARLVRLGERWARERGLRPPETRVDLVAVLRPRRGPAVVDHVRGLV